MRALVFRGGIEQLHHFARDLGQIDRTKCGGSIASLDLRYAREGSEHAQDGIEVRHGIADQRLVMLAVALAGEGLLQPSAHAG
jgi:hypothetical protein